MFDGVASRVSMATRPKMLRTVRAEGWGAGRCQGSSCAALGSESSRGLRRSLLLEQSSCQLLAKQLGASAVMQSRTVSTEAVLSATSDPELGLLPSSGTPVSGRISPGPRVRPECEMESRLVYTQETTNSSSYKVNRLMGKLMERVKSMGPI